MRVSLQKVCIPSESEHTYFLRVDWKGRDFRAGFKLLLTDGQDAWRGEVDEAAVVGEAEELEMDIEQYVQDLQQALGLTGEGSSSSSSSRYSFSLTPSLPLPGAPLALAYEKVHGDLSFQLGSVELDAVPDPVGAVQELLSTSLGETRTLERRNHKLQLENQRFREEQEHIAAEMKKYVVGKETLETELYSRFVLVLNEKKAKIRSLQETIARLEEKGSQEKKDAKPDGLDSDKEEDAKEDDAYGRSTDEEPQEEPPTPSSTSTNLSQGTDSPSLLDDFPDVAPCRKRRVHHHRPPDPPVAKKQTPVTRQRRGSPVVVPAAASKKQRPQRSSATTSPDVEDLFEDI